MATVACKRSRRRPEVPSSQLFTADEIREQQKALLRSSRSRSCVDSHVNVSPPNEGRYPSDRVLEAARRHQRNTERRISCRNKRIRTSCSATEAALQSAISSSSSTCTKQIPPFARCRSATPGVCRSWNHSASPSCSYTSVRSSMISDLRDNDSATSFKSLIECPVSDSWHESDDLNQFRICPQTQIRRVVDVTDSWDARQICDYEWIPDHPYNCTSVSDNELYASTVPSLRKFRRFRIHQPQQFRKTSYGDFDALPNYDGSCHTDDHTDTLDCDIGSNSGLSTDACSFSAAERHWYADDADTRRHCRQRFVGRCFEGDDCILTGDDVRWTPSEGRVCAPVGRFYDSCLPLNSWKKTDDVEPYIHYDGCDDGRFDTNRKFSGVFDGTSRSYVCTDKCACRTCEEVESSEKTDDEKAWKRSEESGGTEFHQKQSLRRSGLPTGTISRRTVKGSSTENEITDGSKIYDDAPYASDDENSKEETSRGESESASIYDDPDDFRPESRRHRGRSRLKTKDQEIETEETSSICDDSDSRYFGTNYSRKRTCKQVFIGRRSTGWSTCASLEMEDRNGESDRDPCLLSSYCADPMLTTCPMQDKCQMTSCNADSREPVCSRARSPSPCMWATGRPTVDSTFTLNDMDKVDCNALAKDVAAFEYNPDCTEPERDVTTLEAELDCTEPGKEFSTLEAEFDCTEPEKEFSTLEAEFDCTEPGKELSTLEVEFDCTEPGKEFSTLEAEFDCTEPGKEFSTLEAEFDCTEPAKEMTTLEAEPAKEMTTLEAEPESNLSEPNREEFEQGTDSSGYDEPLLTVTFRAYIPTASDMYSSEAVPESGFLVQYPGSSMQNSQQMVKTFVVPLYTATTLPPAKVASSLPSQLTRDDMMVLPRSPPVMREDVSSEDQVPMVPSKGKLKEGNVSNFSQEETGSVIPGSLEGADETEPKTQQPLHLPHQSTQQQQHLPHFSDEYEPHIRPTEPREQQLHAQNVQVQAKPVRTKSSVLGHHIETLTVIPENESDSTEFANSLNRRTPDPQIPPTTPLPVTRNQRTTETQTPNQVGVTETLPVQETQKHSAGQIPSSVLPARQAKSEEMVDVAQHESVARTEPSRTSAANQSTGVEPQQTRIPRLQTSDVKLRPRAATSPVEGSRAVSFQIPGGGTFVGLQTPPTPTLLLQIQILPRQKKYVASRPTARRIGSGGILPQLSKIPVPVTTCGTQTSLTLLQLQPDSTEPRKGTRNDLKQPGTPNSPEDKKSVEGNKSEIDFLGNVDTSVQGKPLETSTIPEYPRSKNEIIQTSLIDVKANTTQTSVSLLQQPRATEKDNTDARKDLLQQSESPTSAYSEFQHSEFPEAALDCEVCLKRLGFPNRTNRYKADANKDLQLSESPRSVEEEDYELQRNELLTAGLDCEVCRRALSVLESAHKDYLDAKKDLQLSKSPTSAEEDNDQPNAELPGAAVDSEVGVKRFSLPKSTKQVKESAKKDLQRFESPKSAEQDNELPHAELPGAAIDSEVGVKRFSLLKSTKQGKESAKNELQQFESPISAEQDNELPHAELPGAAVHSEVGQKLFSSPKSTKKDTKDFPKDIDAARPTSRLSNGSNASKIPVRTMTSGPRTSLTQQPSKTTKGTEKGLQHHGAPKPGKDTKKPLHHPSSPETSKHAKIQLKEPEVQKVMTDSKRRDKPPLQQTGSPETSKHTKNQLNEPEQLKVAIDSKRRDKQQPVSPEVSKHAKTNSKEPGSSKVVIDHKKALQPSESPKNVKFDVKTDLQKQPGSDNNKAMQQSSSQKATEDAKTDQKQRSSITYNDKSGTKAFSEVALRAAKGSPVKIANSTLGLMSESDTLKDVPSKNKKNSFGKDTGKQAFVSMSSDLDSTLSDLVPEKVKEKEKKPKPRDSKHLSKTESKQKSGKPARKHRVKVNLKEETNTKRKLREPAAKNPSVPKEWTTSEAAILRNPSALADDEDVPDRSDGNSKETTPQWDPVGLNYHGAGAAVSILKKEDGGGGRRSIRKSKKKSVRLKFNEEVEIMFIDDDEYMDLEMEEGQDDYVEDSSGSEDDHY